MLCLNILVLVLEINLNLINLFNYFKISCIRSNQGYIGPTDLTFNEGERDYYSKNLLILNNSSYSD